MDFDFSVATFIVGIMSLSGVIANIIVATIANKKKRYTDLITQRRLKTFQHIIDCSSNCVNAIYNVYSGIGDEKALLQSFIEGRTQILYNTNYKANAEKELRTALDQLQDLFVNYVEHKDELTKEQKSKVLDTMRKGADYYQAISGVYCKCEWVRIKETTLSVKEGTNTEEEYFTRLKEIEDKIKDNKKALKENTFASIVK